MLFTTDKQTLEDLNIFGRDGVYTIFNRCATRGGAAILEEMFRHPLSDETAINRRSEIIKFFAGSEFPFVASLFDAAETYLANTDERTRLSGKERKLTDIIATDIETQQIQQGVNALVTLLHGMQAFVENITLPAYAIEQEAIFAILNEPGLQIGKGKLTHAMMVELDALLRFRHRDAMRQLLRYSYYLDVYFSVGKVARERGFVFPRALPHGRQTLHLKGVYHPQLAQAIPNNINTPNDSNVIFLTGANMAGKSTFMKSMSIALFLAHMGFPVAATQMEFTVLDGIYTTINLPDNLGMGASHFYAEVLRVKKMAQELREGKHLFIVFDELFRGTNVKDAYEATIAIVKGFAGRTNSLFLISTHIIEAGEILRTACSNVQFVYLPTRMNGTQPVYTYQLESGITDDRHGMIIIRNEGILDILEAGIKQPS